MRLYAKVFDGAAVQVAIAPPNMAPGAVDGRYVEALNRGSLDTGAHWVEIDQSADRPDDTETVTYERDIEMVGGVPVVVWVARPVEP